MTPAKKELSPNQVGYFRALRTEIIEAQKLRVQVGIAKTVFLGTLIGFFFKDGKAHPAILICPIVALMFDCMVYGLSFNIRDVGFYIGGYIEGQMDFKEPWQRYRVARVDRGFKDWGRFVFRLGNYGLSAAVSILALAETMPPGSIRALPLEWAWRLSLIMALVLAWGTLSYVELFAKQVPDWAASVAGGKADGEGGGFSTTSR